MDNISTVTAADFAFADVCVFWDIHLPLVLCASPNGLDPLPYYSLRPLRRYKISLDVPVLASQLERQNTSCSHSDQQFDGVIDRARVK